MSITNNNKLNKNTILNATNDGFSFFKHIIPHLKLNNNNISCKSVLNPFYPDKKPGLSIYYWEGQWRFKDFGNEIYAGSVFDFAALHYGIDPFEEWDLLLTTMMDAIYDFDKEDYKTYVQPNILNRENDFIKVSFNDRRSAEFTSEELAYWEQYGIDGDYSGETDHSIPWQTDQAFTWRTSSASAVEALCQK